MVRYEPWMENARLDVQRDECGCGEIKSMNVERLVDKVTLERVLLPYVVTPISLICSRRLKKSNSGTYKRNVS